MSDAALFIAFFGGLMILRLLVATVAFLVILPPGDRCPNCDHPTLRVESLLYDHVLRWFRKSWCIECGWHGLLRRGPLSEPTPERHYSGQR
ncbi:MAG: hypothetical protein U0164_13710 [Gemmatimonadaceae bacterium]